MKKNFLIALLILVIFSCGNKKKVYKEITADMKEIMLESEKIVNTIKEAKTELPEFDVSKIKELNDKYKAKYENIELKIETGNEQMCRERTKDFIKVVDGFLKMSEDYIQRKGNKANTHSEVAKINHRISAEISLKSNYKIQKTSFQICELAANEKK